MINPTNLEAVEQKAVRKLYSSILQDKKRLKASELLKVKISIKHAQLIALRLTKTKLYGSEKKNKI